VAIRAAELLVIDPATRVLDVGSGVGKFCIVGAAVTGARFTGIEQRGPLVQVARNTAERLGVAGASFVHGTFDAMRIEDFDAFYFFNPFQENVFSNDDRLDETVELCHERFIADVERAVSLLTCAAVGTRVVTYHGFGGEMPPTYRRMRRERRQTGYLELWIKDDGPPRHCL
jgi:SAM-dependent methyltransferase